MLQLKKSHSSLASNILELQQLQNVTHSMDGLWISCAPLLHFGFSLVCNLASLCYLHWARLYHEMFNSMRYMLQVFAHITDSQRRERTAKWKFRLYQFAFYKKWVKLKLARDVCIILKANACIANAHTAMQALASLFSCIFTTKAFYQHKIESKIVANQGDKPTCLQTYIAPFHTNCVRLMNLNEMQRRSVFFIFFDFFYSRNVHCSFIASFYYYLFFFTISFVRCD